MPELNPNIIVPLKALPENWKTVTKTDIANAKRTLDLAVTLNRILGNHFSLMETPKLGKLSTIREMTNLVESGLKRNRLGRGPSQLELIQPLELAERVGFATGRRRRVIASILTRTIDDCYAVLEAGKLLQQGKEPEVLSIEANKALMNLGINNPTILELLKRGIHTLTHVEREISLADARSLVIALGLKQPVRKESTNVEEIAKPKKVKKQITKPLEVVSTLPGVSYLKEDMKRAKPLNMLNRMGATSEAKLTRAIIKCLKNESGYVDVTKGTVMFMNLIKRNFVATFEGKPVNAVIMFEGTKFKVSKLPNDQYGFRIKKVK